MYGTPQKDAGDDSFENQPETPGPVRAKVNHLTKQVSELVGKEHAAMRRHKAETAALENKIAAQKAQLAGTETALNEVRTTLAATQKDLARCKAEGNTMRDELNLFSLVQQQRALLALAEEQVQLVELEQRLVQAEAQRVMRDHKIALFQAREEDLLAEIAERDAQLDELEGSAQSSSSAEADQLRAEKAALAAKVDKLETSVKNLKEKEREARDELDSVLRDEKGKSSGSDKEKKDLQIQLRSTKADLQRKADELADLQEEMSALKEASKEREKALKAKLKAVYEEHGRAAVDDDSPPTGTKARAASPVKKAPAKPKDKVRKGSPVSDGDEDEESPKKKGRKAVATTSKRSAVAPRAVSDSETEAAPTKKRSPVKKSAPKAKEPLTESASDNVKSKKTAAPPAPAEKEKKKTSVPKIVEPEADGADEGDDSAVAAAAPEKKKKRKLLGVQPTFAWDPIMGSGDGVIPTSLSPMKPAGKAVGTIPRLGFPSMASSRSFGRF